MKSDGLRSVPINDVENHVLLKFSENKFINSFNIAGEYINEYKLENTETRVFIINFIYDSKDSKYISKEQKKEIDKLLDDINYKKFIGLFHNLFDSKKYFMEIFRDPKFNNKEVYYNKRENLYILFLYIIDLFVKNKNQVFTNDDIRLNVYKKVIKMYKFFDIDKNVEYFNSYFNDIYEKEKLRILFLLLELQNILNIDAINSFKESDNIDYLLYKTIINLDYNNDNLKNQLKILSKYKINIKNVYEYKYFPVINSLLSIVSSNKPYLTLDRNRIMIKNFHSLIEKKNFNNIKILLDDYEENYFYKEKGSLRINFSIERTLYKFFMIYNKEKDFKSYFLNYINECIDKDYTSDADKTYYKSSFYKLNELMYIDDVKTIYEFIKTKHKDIYSDIVEKMKQKGLEIYE